MTQSNRLDWRNSLQVHRPTTRTPANKTKCAGPTQIWLNQCEPQPNQNNKLFLKLPRSYENSLLVLNNNKLNAKISSLLSNYMASMNKRDVVDEDDDLISHNSIRSFKSIRSLRSIRSMKSLARSKLSAKR